MNRKLLSECGKRKKVGEIGIFSNFPEKLVKNPKKIARWIKKYRKDLDFFLKRLYIIVMFNRWK